MNSPVVRPIFVGAALDLLPPEIRHSLLEDRSFIRQWELSTDCSVTLGSRGPTFLRDRLYEGFRTAIRTPAVEVVVQDQNNADWTLKAQPTGHDLAFSVSGGGQFYALMDHSALADDGAVRAAWFERKVCEIYIDAPTYRKWLSRLKDSPLSDDEFADLMVDIEMTPVNMLRTLQTKLAQPGANAEALVPNDVRYFERLIGSLSATNTVPDYIEAGAKPLIASVQHWNSFQGFLNALLTCSTGHITNNITFENLGFEELKRAYLWVAENGDPVTRLAAVEVAISKIDTLPELAFFIERTVGDFIADDPTSDSSDFALLSAAIVMTGSELARRRALGSVPPFYRKHAAMAHASLIVRAIKGSPVDPASFTRWIQTSRLGQAFLLQGLIDLRLEPRWLPDFVGADQLRAEFIGRIANAASQNQEKIRGASLRKLLIGQSSKLASAASWPFPNLPGPLEGATSPSQLIPDEILQDMRAALSSDRLAANSFAGLVNTAMLFNLPQGESNFAALALRRVKFSVENSDDEDKMFGLVGGLAIVAAVTRGNELADALRVLTRVIRRRKRIKIEADAEMRIAMIAAAAFEQLDEWAKFAGEWITEIAFEMEDKEAAQGLLQSLRRMVQLEPELARHCAAGDAALAALSMAN